MANEALLSELQQIEKKAWSKRERRTAARWGLHVACLSREINQSLASKLKSEVRAERRLTHLIVGLMAGIIVVVALLAGVAVNSHRYAEERDALRDFIDRRPAADSYTPYQKTVRARLDHDHDLKLARIQHQQMVAAVCQTLHTCPPSVPRAITAIQREAKIQGIDPWLFVALVREESAYREDAVSPVGAIGLAQVMPKVWVPLLDHLTSADDLYDIDANIKAGMIVLARELERANGNVKVALYRYNGASPESWGLWNFYPDVVLSRMRQMRGSA